MSNNEYICPKCGRSLGDERAVTFKFCPYCGGKLEFSRKANEESGKAGVRQFVSSDTNVRLATAVVPDSYTLTGALAVSWQSDFVPYTSVIHAADPDSGIVMVSASKEMYTDYCNPALKQMIRLSTTVIRSSLQDYTEPDEYLTAWASGMTGLELTPVAKTTLPTDFAANPDQSANLLYRDYQQAASLEASVGYQLVNLACEPLLIKYQAHTDHGDRVVLCGGEIWGYEVATSMFHLPDGITDAVGKAFSGIKDAFAGGAGGTGQSVGGMTFNDLMRGGLIGKKMREGKAAAQYPTQPDAPQPAAAQQSRPQYKEIPPDGKIPLGHAKDYGKHTDIIVWGSKRRYLLVAPAEMESEATEVFLKFAASVTTDPALEQQAGQMIAERLQQIGQLNSQLQTQAYQKQMQTRQMQMQTSQMIARNSRQISDGIMDSWNKRQAAQSRMSANYSEAVRGVNSYTTPSGSSVEFSVGADHVYQNQYGDTFGVSGSAVDPDVRSKLNWTELQKKE